MVINKTSVGVKYNKNKNNQNYVLSLEEIYINSRPRIYCLYLGASKSNNNSYFWPKMEDVFDNSCCPYNDCSNSKNLYFSVCPEGKKIQNKEVIIPGSKIFVFKNSLSKCSNKQDLLLAKERFEQIFTNSPKNEYNELITTEKSFNSSSLYDVNAVSDLLTLEL